MRQASPKDFVLLGEAPKSRSGFAFAPEDFTTQQITAALKIPPDQLHHHFWLQNVFDFPQASSGIGDAFPESDAVLALTQRHFPTMNIICIGSRVKKALELALGLEGIPTNSVSAFRPQNRAGTWILGHISHPASRHTPITLGVSTLTKEARKLLLAASGGRTR